MPDPFEFTAEEKRKYNLPQEIVAPRPPSRRQRWLRIRASQPGASRGIKDAALADVLKGEAAQKDFENQQRAAAGEMNRQRLLATAEAGALADRAERKKQKVARLRGLPRTPSGSIAVDWSIEHNDPEIEKMRGLALQTVYDPQNDNDKRAHERLSHIHDALLSSVEDQGLGWKYGLFGQSVSEKQFIEVAKKNGYNNDAFLSAWLRAARDKAGRARGKNPTDLTAAQGGGASEFLGPGLSWRRKKVRVRGAGGFGGLPRDSGAYRDVGHDIPDLPAWNNKPEVKGSYWTRFRLHQDP